MWHQRGGPPSLSCKSSGDHSLPSMSTSSNDFPSSGTLTDSDYEKSPLVSSPEYYADFESPKRWKYKPRTYRSSNTFTLKRSLRKSYNRIKKRVSAILANCYYFQYIKRKSNQYLFNKHTVTLLIVTVTLLITCKQVYSPLAYFHPPNTWKYLEEGPYDFVSDDKVVELVQYLYKNADEHANYYYNDIGVFDRRVTPALYLHDIIRHFNGKDLDESLKYDFSWIDWIDFDQRLLPKMDYLMNHNGVPISNCSQFASEIGFPHDNIWRKDTLTNCTDLTDMEIGKLHNLNYPHFETLAPLDNYELPIEARIVHGATYLYHNAPSPQRLIFVDGLSETDFVVPVSNPQSYKRALFPSKLNLELALTPLEDLMSNLVTELSSSDDRIYNKDVIYDIARVSKNLYRDKTKFDLTPEDFYNPTNLTEIRQLLEYLNTGNSLDHKLYSNILNEFNNYPNGDYPKYFHEPRLNDNKIGGSHYDWRFFNIKEVDNEYKRISNLNRLIRAWLRFTNNEDIKTWIAHGTLLGYSFNGFMLPWDYDHDVQVSASGMWKMAKYYNQSLVIDCTTDDQFSSGYGQYLLDISSNFFNRSNSNGNNAIDARFIDIHTGMYIDITELSDISDKAAVLKEDIKSFDKVLKRELYRLLKQKRVSIDQIIQEDDLVGCKNHHFYRYEELSTFERGVFEGECAYVPSAYASILDREFPRRKTSWRHEGYTWRSGLSLWVYNQRCGKRFLDRTDTSCLRDGYVQLVESLINSEKTETGIADRRSVFPDWEAVAGVSSDTSQIGNRRNTNRRV